MAFHGPTPVDLDELDDESPSFFAEINITPLTDVILVLLIIFMVSSSAMVDAIRTGTLDVTLPAASTAAKEDAQETSVVVGITADGRTYVSGKAVDDDQLLAVLKERRKSDPNTLVVIQADGDLQHRRVVEVLDLLRKSGFRNIGIGAETN